MCDLEVEEFMKRNDWEPPNYRFVVLVLLMAVLVPIVVLRILAMVQP